MADRDDASDLSTDESVSAADFVRGFAKWRDTAQTSPVFISTHGRVTHVLTNVEQFQRMALAASDTSRMSQSSLYGLADYVREGVVVVDAEERILYANPFAKAYFGFPDQFIGEAMLDLLPGIAGSMFIAQIRRTGSSREPLAADLPSVLKPDRWLHFQTIPLHANVAITFRDITEEVSAHRLADVKQATIHAISQHPDVGYIRLSPTALIERVDETFSNWIGLSEERLAGVKIVDLLQRKDRAEASEAISLAVNEGKECRFRANFAPNREGLLVADCSCVPLRGAYGLEGAIIVFTRVHD